MSDISMCMSQTCTKKETCYRFTAYANKHRQSYGSFKQVDGKCDYYWEVEPKNEKKCTK